MKRIALKQLTTRKRPKEGGQTMKKITVILMLAVMGLVFGCNTEEPKGKNKNRVVFEPICRKPAPKGNYVTTTDWDNEKMENCYHCNLKHMVGMIFMAYPCSGSSLYAGKPFYEDSQGKQFGVVSPEKFTIEAVDPYRPGSISFMKVKFESGKIGHIDVFSYFYSTEPFPEFAECVGICRKACQ